MRTTEYTYWVTVQSESGDCELELYEGTRFVDHYQGGRLDLDREFSANEVKLTLRELRERLITYDLQGNDPIFNERGQLDIGRQLFSQIFGLSGKKERGLLNKIVDVRIISDDEEVAALPWSLLYGGKLFLATSGWSVALSALRGNCRDAILGPSPKILIVAPPPLIDFSHTQAAEHIKELELMLSTCNKLHRLGEHLQYVESWPDFVAKVETYQPDVLYYYGHGEGNKASSHLIFASPDGLVDRIPVADFARVLGRLGKNAPLITYVNCCQGDAGGLLGVRGQLGDLIPAVITNCTKAYVPAARKQALSIWNDILIEGKPPHEAIANTRINLDKLDLTFKDLRWLTPVLHYSYRSWSYKPPRRIRPAAANLRWRHKLDRQNQFGNVLDRAEVVLDRSQKKSLAFMVYGGPRQGIQDFYDRVESELPDKLKFEVLETIKPSWPPEFVDNYHLSFSETICKAFDIIDLDEIGDRVEAELCKRSPTSNLMFIRHRPIELGVDQAMLERHLKRLQKYLDWIDKFLVREVPQNVKLIIEFSFTVPETSEFKNRAEALANDLHFAQLQFVVLQELGPIARRELETFVDDNEIPLPSIRDKDHIGEILEATQGAFEDVLERVKHLAERAWDSAG